MRLECLLIALQWGHNFQKHWGRCWPKPRKQTAEYSTSRVIQPTISLIARGIASRCNRLVLASITTVIKSRQALCLRMTIGPRETVGRLGESWVENIN